MRSGVLAVLLLAGAAAHAAELQRRGEGTLRWFGLKVYEATLRTEGAAPEFTQRFTLELRYARALRGAAIAQRSHEEIARLGFGTPAQREIWRAAMGRLFPDVAAGDTLTGEHLPGRGARFLRNGRALGEIADPEFARAFFSIWLDPRTSAPDLRAALLGGGS